MTNKPKGGRGIKAPYQTTVLRVPVPLIDKFEKHIDEFRELALQGITNDNEPRQAVNKFDNQPLTQLEAIEQAQKIIKQRKSAKLSLNKLLQVIYNDKSISI